MSLPPHNTRVFVRDSRSERFLAFEGWTSNVAEARDFLNPIAACRFVAENMVKNAQLVLQFTAGAYQGRSISIVPL
jgi:hypothetical protein